MKHINLHAIFKRPCKFKLKSGKEIFGVIWQENETLLFSSLEGYRMILGTNSNQLQNALTTEIQEDDILGAEVIHALAS